ncbi:MAG: response regulator [Deltaproteobacteria bacterium]|nr:response regulator [Deltaproteobacteria bacterium]
MINVMILERSEVVSTTLRALLHVEPDMKVVATITDPVTACETLKIYAPDVLMLDMDLLNRKAATFLLELMSCRTTPTILMLAEDHVDTPEIHDALLAGAVDSLVKPKGDTLSYWLSIAPEMTAKIRRVAQTPPRRHSKPSFWPLTATTAELDALLPLAPPSQRVTGPPVVCIGASAGGTRALEHLLSRLHPPHVPIVVVQHMPATFTATFARRLNSISELEVVEGENGMPTLPNRVIVAKGGVQTLLFAVDAGYRTVHRDGPAVNFQMPSVDALFRSAANVAGAGALGIILTGMGSDGAQGLLEMRQMGAATVAQDEASCLVFGMPQAAIHLGAAMRVVPLDGMADLITAFSRERHLPYEHAPDFPLQVLRH